MKIAVIHSIYKPDTRGGAEVVVESIAEGLKAAGHEVFVIAVGHENKSEFIDGLKVFRIKSSNLFNFLDINDQPVWKRLLWHPIDMFNDLQTWRVFKIISAEKPELVLTHSLKGLGYGIPQLIKILGLKHIHTVHDMQLIHPSGLLGADEKIFKLARLYCRLCRQLFGSPSAVVFPSEYLKDIYSRLKFFPQSQLAVLGNPLSAGLKIASAKTAADRLVMAYVGQLEPYKGVIDLIKITQGLAGDWELLIAGDGSAKREAVKWSLDSGKIKLLGRLTSIELEQQIWSKADILINPSKVAESFGLVVIEAYARGIPVLASSIGALKELVNDQQTGWLFKAGDQLDLKRNIEFILANRDRLVPMKANCLAVAREFQLDNYLSRLLEL